MEPSTHPMMTRANRREVNTWNLIAFIWPAMRRDIGKAAFSDDPMAAMRDVAALARLTNGLFRSGLVKAYLYLVAASAYYDKQRDWERVMDMRGLLEASETASPADMYNRVSECMRYVADEAEMTEEEKDRLYQPGYELGTRLFYARHPALHDPSFEGGGFEAALRHEATRIDDRSRMPAPDLAPPGDPSGSRLVRDADIAATATQFGPEPKTQ